MRRHVIRYAALTIGGLVAVALALGLGTGRIAYVTTHGVSMEPRFHTGDLAVLRAAGVYHVGEVVAYRSSLLGTTVLHRIVAEHGGLFTFKGDNNSAPDPEHLGPGAIVGVLAFRLPHGGRYLAWLRSPLHAVLLGALGCSTLGLYETLRRRRRPEGPRRSRPRGSRVPGVALLATALVALGVSGALAALVLTSVGPSTTSTSVPYSSTITFSYHGEASRGAVYPTGRVETGEPVFVRLVHELWVRARYRLDAPATSVLAGRIALSASLVEPNGWSRLLVQQPPMAFEGSGGSTSIGIPLAATASLLERAANETGLTQSGETVVVTASVMVTGMVGTHAFSSSMRAPLSFQMSPVELNLTAVPNATGAASYPELVATKQASYASIAETPGAPRLAGGLIGIALARRLAAVVGALGLLLGAVGIVARARHQPSEEERLRRRIRRASTPIASDPASTGRSVIDVASLGALVDLADRFDVVVLDLDHPSGHSYYIEIGDVFYRFGTEALEKAVEGDRVQGAGADAPGTEHRVASGGRISTTEEAPVSTERFGEAATVAPVARQEPGVIELDEIGTPGAVARVIPIGARRHPRSPTPQALEASEVERVAIGLNSWLVEEKRRDYLSDPSSVDPSWREFFASPSEAAASD